MSVLQITTNESAPRKVNILAGTIRRANGKWTLLNDVGHSPIGLNPVITEPTMQSIEVKFDKKYSKVLSCSVTADESYTAQGFQFGASCGLDKIIIHHSRRGIQSNNSELNISGSNIWISIMMYD